MRPEEAKALVQNPCIPTLLPFQGELYRFISTQGDALGYVLVAPSGRIMNVYAYSAVRAGFLEGGVEIDVKKLDYLLE